MRVRSVAVRVEKLLREIGDFARCGLRAPYYSGGRCLARSSV